MKTKEEEKKEKQENIQLNIYLSGTAKTDTTVFCCTARPTP